MLTIPRGQPVYEDLQINGVADYRIQKVNGQIQKYPICNGKEVSYQPSRLWLRDLASRGMSPIADQLQKQIAKEILINADDPNFPDQLIDNWRKYGFVVVDFPSLDTKGLPEKTYEVMQEVFKKPVEELKKHFGHPGLGSEDGYLAPGAEESQGARDSKKNQFQFIHRVADKDKNKGNLPGELGERFKNTTDDLVDLLHDDVAVKIARAMAIGLKNKGFQGPDSKELDDNFFVDLMNEEDAKRSSLNLLRLTHCQAAEELESNDASCSAPHVDLNFFTVLPTADAKGLQIWYEDPDNQKNSGWVPLNAKPGAFIVNLADLAETMTSAYLKSTPHRVVAPSGQTRQSIIYFASLRRHMDVLAHKLKNNVIKGFENFASQWELETIPRLLKKVTQGVADTAKEVWEMTAFTPENYTDLRKHDIGFLSEEDVRERGMLPLSEVEYLGEAT